MTKATILASNLNAFNAFVATKNKKAVKLGCPEIKVEVSAPYVKEVKMENGDMVSFQYVDLSIDESAIKLGNYSVVGRIDDVEGSIIVSGMTDMKKYRNYSMSQCDHCNTNRPRKHLILVKEGEKELAIGSQCLNDFVGHPSALSYVAAMQWVYDLAEIVEEEGFTTGTSSNAVYSVERVLNIAAAVIRMDGQYISKKTAEDRGEFYTTKDGVFNAMFSKESNLTVTDADRESTKKALEWFEATEHDDSDFFYNLKTLLSKSYVPTKMFGYIIALFPVYYRALEKAADSSAKSEFIGNVGDKKVSMKLKCKRVIPLVSMYGVSNLYIFCSGSNVVTYKSNAFKAEVGQELEVVATIKEHSVYNNTKQTVITRAKAL